MNVKNKKLGTKTLIPQQGLPNMKMKNTLKIKTWHNVRKKVEIVK
jgi:hypothetical protein